MEVDMAKPVIQVAVIALVGVILSATVGFFGAILGAGIGARSARDTDERRRRWEIDEWHREKGVAAAEAILDLMIELDLTLFSSYSPRQRENWGAHGPCRAP